MRTHAHGAARSGPLSLAYEAFQALHRPHYLLYARAHLGPARATEAVHSAFAALLDAWPAVISSGNPSTRAWELLTEQVHSRTGARVRATDLLREDLQTLATLGYSAELTATVTGLSLGSVRSLTRSGSPALPS
ncbi:hypothetical protein [Streptomyces sp. NPDC059909]|uniref:hypothetical protein n=1 Tax=Streptomyces sp. NPDC059909 TaxID=3346998 RepID=UPI00365E91F3